MKLRRLLQSRIATPSVSLRTMTESGQQVCTCVLVSYSGIGGLGMPEIMRPVGRGSWLVSWECDSNCDRLFSSYGVLSDGKLAGTRFWNVLAVDPTRFTLVRTVVSCPLGSWVPAVSAVGSTAIRPATWVLLVLCRDSGMVVIRE